MSVPENARTKSKLEVNVKAHDLCCYTLQITANKKIFTEKYVESLRFKLHEKKSRLYELSDGIEYLGFTFRLTPTGKVLMHIKSENVKAERRKLHRLVKKSKRGGIPRHKVNESYAAWRNHASKGNCFKCIQRMDAYYKSLWEE